MLGQGAVTTNLSTNMFKITKALALGNPVSTRMITPNKAYVRGASEANLKDIAQIPLQDDPTGGGSYLKVHIVRTYISANNTNSSTTVTGTVDYSPIINRITSQCLNYNTSTDYLNSGTAGFYRFNGGNEIGPITDQFTNFFPTQSSYGNNKLYDVVFEINPVIPTHEISILNPSYCPMPGFHGAGTM
jgi:hypothetical protein